MKQYRLLDHFKLRKIDEALFNFSKAEVINFNSTGFKLLERVVSTSGFSPSNQDETDFLAKLLNYEIIAEV